MPAVSCQGHLFFYHALTALCVINTTQARRATLADLCQLYRASAKLPLIVEALRAHEGPARDMLEARYAAPLATAHDEQHLTKFEELLEAAVDLERIPDEYLIGERQCGAACCFLAMLAAVCVVVP